MKIYIDGSCRPSTKVGGYGVLVFYDNRRVVLKERFENVTNNIMELSALIAALRYIRDNELDKHHEIEIFCDSMYVVKGVNEWWPKWKAKGYRTTTGVVANLEFWKVLEKLNDQVKYKLIWVKGHAGNKEHNEIDKIVFNLTA